MNYWLTGHWLKSSRWPAGGSSGSAITDAEIKALSETLYRLDSNKASPSQLIIDPQALVSDSQTSSKNDLSSRRWQQSGHRHQPLPWWRRPNVVSLLLSACSSSWTSSRSSPNPPTPLCWRCWTTTRGWRGRRSSSQLSSWPSRTPFSRRPCPTLSWAESCLLSSTPKVATTQQVLTSGLELKCKQMTESKKNIKTYKYF